MFRRFASIVLTTASLLTAQAIPAFSQNASPATSGKDEEAKALAACAQAVIDQAILLKVPGAQDLRFQGKVSEATALCRGGEQASAVSWNPLG